MLQHANPTELIPDLVKLIMGATISFPERFPSPVSHRSGSLHLSPPLLSASMIHASREEKWWDDYTYQET